MVRKFVLSAQKPTGRNGQYSLGGMTKPQFTRRRSQRQTASVACAWVWDERTWETQTEDPPQCVISWWDGINEGDF